MASANFRTLSKTDFAQLFGVQRMVPGHSFDLHVHSDVPRLGRVNPADATGNAICGCLACELYDLKYTVNTRLMINQKRALQPAGKHLALQPPERYDSGAMWGLPGPDIQVLGNRVLSQLVAAKLDAPPKAVAQDQSYNSRTVQQAQQLQIARNEQALDGIVKDATAIADDTGLARFLLGVTEKKATTGVKRPAPPPPMSAQEKFAAAKQPAGPVLKVGK